MMTQTGPPVSQPDPSTAGGRPIPQRRRNEPRPEPVRSENYAHLDVGQLRELRTVLTDEEDKVSYWRRILQARIDVLQAGATGRELDPSRLTPVLSGERMGAGRSALIRVLPVDDVPPLPSLAELWERRVEPGDAPAHEQFIHDLRIAEKQLSDYRSALHIRIAEATSDLIARYKEQPLLCLAALPLPPPRPARR